MKKIISCILLCLVVLCSFPLLAFAKTEEIVVPVGEGSTSRVFQITWPNTDQEASVTITSCVQHGANPRGALRGRSDCI